MRRISGVIITLSLFLGLALGLMADGPLTNFLNLGMRTDANGYLITTASAYTGPDGPLTALSNLRGRTDANGYLLTTFGSGLNVTAGTDSTLVSAGSPSRFRYQTSITPATAGTGNCAASFKAAALTADCTIATLPAGMKLVSVYGDVTAGFTCSGTCTGTKVMQAGTAAGGTQVLAASFDVTTTGTAGLTDAQLGSGMTRAASIQGGLIGSWATTTPISVRFTSGTGNWGNATATFVNAGAVTFTLITEQIK